MPTFFASFTQHQQVAEIVVSSCAHTQNDGESLQYKANRSSQSEVHQIGSGPRKKPPSATLGVRKSYE